MLSSGEVPAIQRPVDRQRSAQTSGAIDQGGFRTIEFNGADQHCGRKARALGHHIETVVHAVDEVHIRDAWWAKEYVGPSGSASRGMACAIFLADVCFDFDNPAGDRSTALLADEGGAHQVLRNLECWPIKKPARQRAWHDPP